MIYSYIKSVPGCQQELKKNRLAGGRFGFHMSFSPFLSGGGERTSERRLSHSKIFEFLLFTFLPAPVPTEGGAGRDPGR